MQSSSTTAQRIQAVRTSPTFTRLGPLARLAGVALGQAARVSGPEALELATRELDERWESLTARWQRQWEAAGLDDKVAADTRELSTSLWNIFKALLFTVVMLYDGLLEGLLDAIPSPTVAIPLPPDAPLAEEGLLGSNIPPFYLASVHSALLSLSNLSFVSAPMGDGFEALKRTFYSSLDVLARDGRASASLVRTLAAKAEQSRDRTTYFLDTCEQLVPALNDRLQREVLQVCKV